MTRGQGRHESSGGSRQSLSIPRELKSTACQFIKVLVKLASLGPSFLSTCITDYAKSQDLQGTVYYAVLWYQRYTTSTCVYPAAAVRNNVDRGFLAPSLSPKGLFRARGCGRQRRDYSWPRWCESGRCRSDMTRAAEVRLPTGQLRGYDGASWPPGAAGQA